MEVQVFGTHKNQDTRKALRFFSERRVRVHFMDFRERAASRGELMRFVRQFGLTALIDRDSRRYADLGLASGRYSDETWIERLCDEPFLLRQPLARFGQLVTIGLAESAWATWTEAGKGT